MLLRVDWSRASREDGDQLGGDYSRPGEEWMIVVPPGAIMVELERSGWIQHK